MMNTQVVNDKELKAIDCTHFIDGRYFTPENAKTFNNINPATERVIGTVTEGGQEEIDLAVNAARKALNGPWKTITLHERSKNYT